MNSRLRIRAAFLALGTALGSVFVTPPATLHAQRLFRTTEPLEVTFTTSLKALVRDRDSLRLKPHGALMTYKETNGTLVSIPVTLQTRGHFRRQARNCDFPPLLVEFKKKAADKTVLQGNTRLKLTTNCKPKNTEFEQYVLQEYAVYRLYERISPMHFRTRLAKVVYKDSANATPDVSSWAFFIEDDKEVAKELKVASEKAKGAFFDQLEPTQLAITSLFEYFIGNTDWSISQQHNIALMHGDGFTVSPVAYDFDWSGVVNPRYAFPDARLGIAKVTDRLYRGPCRSAADWGPIFARFIDARPAIDSIYNAVPSLEPKRVKSSIEFYNDFYKTIGDVRGVKRALIDPCQKEGN